MILIPVWQSARKKWRYDFKPTNEVPVYHTGTYRLTSSPGRLALKTYVLPVFHRPPVFSFLMTVNECLRFCTSADNVHSTNVRIIVIIFMMVVNSAPLSRTDDGVQRDGIMSMKETTTSLSCVMTSKSPL